MSFKDGYLSFEGYKEKVFRLNDIYWYSSFRERWAYMEEVLSELKIINPKNAIEIGTNRVSLMDFSDSIDFDINRIDPDCKNEKLVFDASKTPYPIEDKKYDVFVALQVLEHLGCRQMEAFKEIERISKHAIITLPYLWDCPEDPVHHQIGMEKINEWTCGKTPYKTDIRLDRIMLCYEF